MKNKIPPMKRRYRTRWKKKKKNLFLSWLIVIAFAVPLLGTIIYFIVR